MLHTLCIDPVHIRRVPGCLWPVCLPLVGKAGLGLPWVNINSSVCYHCCCAFVVPHVYGLPGIILDCAKPLFDSELGYCAWIWAARASPPRTIEIRRSGAIVFPIQSRSTREDFKNSIQVGHSMSSLSSCLRIRLVQAYLDPS